MITESAVLQMARGVRELLRTDAAVAVSGAGGPEGQDGQPAGTVWIAVSVGEDTRTEKHLFDGSPEEILARTTTRALTLLRETIKRGSA
ncbi:CinA family protein [Corynebacterium guangdongense]|uniref:PncC family amidohydrolase n=1 Tax=Corynebacterium guangdongense TaxID=1783348 RepID=A0ABU1ZZM0_9CORY|nr:CinA family protein [Corynebacterium guangdongense]MDR7329343.1 PncC family amidohydrolase [Corynebacterium guangdongense]